MDTFVHVGVDEDDPELDRYRYVFEKAGREDDFLHVGPRKGLAAWTNQIATTEAENWDYLASFGDDHVPVTPGFDKALTRGIEDMGGTGFTYPWDGTREDIPEAVVASSDIVKTLGWFCLPELRHWYVDNVWASLGRGAGCLRHLRAVSVEHVHPATGKAKADSTTRDNGKSLAEDQAAYYRWRRTRMADDVKKILELRKGVLLLRRRVGGK